MLSMAQTLSCTRLTNDLARLMAGSVDATTSCQRLVLLSQTSMRDGLTRKLGIAASESSAQLDVIALLSEARASRAASSALTRAAFPAPASTSRAGSGGGPSGGYTIFPASSTAYCCHPHVPEPYRSPPSEIGPQGRDRDRDEDRYRDGHVSSEGGCRRGGGSGSGGRS